MSDPGVARRFWRMRVTSPCPRRMACWSAVTPPRSANWRIGAGAQENRHDLLIALRAVAEDHRLQQSGPTKIVHVVDIDVGAYDAPHQ